MKTIIFKSYYLTKCLYWLFGTGGIISALIFLKFNTSTGFKLQISTTIVGLGSIFVIYLNRLEPHYIKFNNTTFTVDYINKFIFKPTAKTFLKEQIKVSLKNDALILYDNGKKIAIVRRKALEKNDWEILNQYFC